MAPTSDKELVVIILDVGSTMVAPPGQRIETALRAVLLLIQQKIIHNIKDLVSLVLCGTRETDNQMGDDYKNISVIYEPQNPTVGLLRDIELLQPGGANADFIDALIVGMDILHSRKDDKKTEKRVFLVTDAGCKVNKDHLDLVVRQFRNLDAVFSVMGIDFVKPDDPSFDSVSRPSIKKENERLLYEIADQVGGIVLNHEEALEQMMVFKSKKVNPRTMFRGQLEIGDEIRMPLWCWAKTMELKFPTMKKQSLIADQLEETDTDEVKLERTYHRTDNPDLPVDEEQRVRGFKYGKTLTPFSKADQELLKYQSTKELKLLGFTKASNVPRHHFMSKTNVFVCEPGFDCSEALSALIHAMAETDVVAIVRFIWRENATPQLCVFSPRIKAKGEYFICNQLPFLEDIRQYLFAPLCTSATRKSFVPSEEQLAAADNLIDSLDLMKGAIDADGNPTEALNPKYTYNPALQRFYQALHARALNPDAPIPDAQLILKRFMEADESFVRNAQPSFELFARAFPLTRTERVLKTDRKFWSETTGVDIELDSYAPDPKKRRIEEGDLSMQSIVGGVTMEVGSINPVKDFQDLISRRDVDLVERAVEQMKSRIIQLVNDSMRDQLYSKAIDCLVALRKGCVQEGESIAFNTHLRQLRAMYEGKRRADFWTLIVSNQISLIHEGESDDSPVTEEESKSFLAVAEKPIAAPKQDQEAEDLFDQIE